MSDSTSIFPSSVKTISELLRYQVERNGHKDFSRFISSSGQVLQERKYNQFFSDVSKKAYWLRSAGLKKGDRVFVLLDHRQEAVDILFALFEIGVVASLMPMPYLLGDSNWNLLKKLIASFSPQHVITFDKVISLARSSKILCGLPIRFIGIEDINRGVSNLIHVERPMDIVNEGDIAYVQFSSGSIADPQGILLTNRNIIESVRSMVEPVWGRIKGGSSVSWLPFYHDMGLFGGVFIPLALAGSSTFIDPLAYVKCPLIWIETISKYQASISYTPNFGLGILVKKTEKVDLSGLNLSSMECLVIGSEPILASTLNAFIERFSKIGFSRQSLVPAYGLGENTLAVSANYQKSGSKIFHIKRESIAALFNGNFEKEWEFKEEISRPSERGEISFVSLGESLSKTEAKIFDSNGEQLPPFRVGEISIRGASLFQGYYRHPRIIRPFTKEGWFLTGDLGFFDDRGNLFFVTRKKELIIKGGKNYFPHDIEVAAESVEGIRKGSAACFGVASDEGTEDIILLAELNTAGNISALRFKVYQEVLEQVQVGLEEIIFLPLRTIPKTSSGKIKRREAKRRYEEGEWSSIVLS